MASIIGKELTQGTTVAVSALATLTIEKEELLSKDVNFVGYIKVSDGSSPIFTVIIEHSVDGETWETLLAFTAISADVVETVHVDNTTTFALRFVRARVSAYTSGTANVHVALLYDRV